MIIIIPLKNEKASHKESIIADETSKRSQLEQLIWDSFKKIAL